MWNVYTIQTRLKTVCSRVSYARRQEMVLDKKVKGIERRIKSLV